MTTIVDVQINQETLQDFTARIREKHSCYTFIGVVLYDDGSGWFFHGGVPEEILDLDFNSISELNYMTANPDEFLEDLV